MPRQHSGHPFCYYIKNYVKLNLLYLRLQLCACCKVKTLEVIVKYLKMMIFLIICMPIVEK